MKREPIDQVFKRLEGRLDTAAPSADHKANFLAKLQAQANPEVVTKETKTEAVFPRAIQRGNHGGWG